MIVPSVNKEYSFIDSGNYGRRGYDDDTRVGGWVAGGIAFLFLVFIIFGIGFFLNGRHDHVNDTIRDRTGLSNAEVVAAATARGAAAVRQEDTYLNTRATLDKLDALAVAMTHGFDVAICTSKEAANTVIRHGDEHGFRDFSIVYENPCDRDHGRRRGRGECEVEHISLQPAPTGLLVGEGRSC
ncbi:hypothetical protein HDG34_005892 [Paraburkholderia sp. HC6.4b]|uniref:hypothetical protein n=1 Tax=unclassified Paraburkholderia TaxID=2615204 RepID=UPI00161F58FE|nr:MULTISPECIES: hypothetical protein [unclassified Paraburkholderia]MBB5411926.1 hypothetical protein [Paraburkholderia sp. HC6.4b]MBB5450238.1 hypothetical protein [Paraburkholderia sp. Kb1A]